MAVVSHDGPVLPPGWPTPRGYSNGYRIGDTLFVGGQVAFDQDERIVGPGDFVAQFGQALRNVRAVVEAAGGRPDQVGRMTVFVTDREAYLGATRALGPVWREVFGRHYPAMALVIVAGLVEPDAMVEIEATAVLT